LGTLWTWEHVLASAGELKRTPVLPQGMHLPPDTAERGFLIAEELCWEGRKFQSMSGKEGQTERPRHFWRTQCLTQSPLLFIQRDHSLGQPLAPPVGCWATQLPELKQGLHLAIRNALASLLWRGQRFFPSPSAAGWWINHRLHYDPTQCITLITAEEGIPVPWRNERSVFQASRFIKCFYSITLQLQGVVSGGLHL